MTPTPKWILRSFDWEKNLNEDGKKWYHEQRINTSWDPWDDSEVAIDF